MFCDTGGRPERENEIFREFTSWNADGIIFFKSPVSPSVEELARTCPHVFIGNSGLCPGEKNLLSIDRRIGGFKIADHLVNYHGYAKIAFVTSSLRDC